MSSKRVRNLICKRLDSGGYHCRSDSDGGQVTFSAESLDLSGLEGEVTSLYADFREPLNCGSAGGRLECTR
jgi:hypothetical protein